MSKIVVSWISYNNDFSEGQFNLKGPNANLHTYHLHEYEKHLWLMSWKEGNEKEEQRETRIKNYLNNKKLNDKVELKFIDISDPTDINEIRSKIEPILLAYRNYDIDIFISPGTPAMSLVWYLIKISSGLNIRLFKTREEKHLKTETKIPEREYIEIEKDTTSYSAIIKEVDLESKIYSDYLITDSIKPVFEKASKIAQTDNVTVLIYGDSGTGKEYLANFIHENSSRKNKNFLALNCSAFTDEILESRLFGHKRGSFTGAVSDQKGIFEQCDGGTIFLDEIGDISPYMQQSLLRVIQKKEILPVGDNNPRKIDVRIISATNKNLVEMCKEGKFRWDLYYRLSVVELELPTLIERGQKELEEYIDFFIKKFRKKFNKTKVKLSKEARNILLTYTYPGNIRELENILEHCFVFADNEITKEHLPKRLYENSLFSWKWEDVEKQHILKAMKFFKGNKAEIARELGYAPNTLYSKMKKYGIEC